MFKKPLSIILALLMAVSVFAAAPITASANEMLQLIDELFVSGVVQPVVGVSPEKNMNALRIDVDGVSVYGMSWSKINTPKIDSMTSSDVFEELGEYRVRIYLQAEPGNKFVLNDKDFPDVTAKINGLNASVAKINGREPSEYICLACLFVPAQPTVLDSVALTGLDEPEDGENPDFTVTAPEGVTVDSVDWQKSGQMLDASDTFTGGETYTARIFLSANPGYKFAVDGADTAVWATINGRTSGINKYDSYELSDKICVALGFLAPTEMSTITDIEITDVPAPVPGQQPSYEVNAPWFVDYEAVWNTGETGRFDYNSKYSLSLYLYSKSGWNFAVDEEGEPAVNVTINGQPVEVLKVHGEKPSKQIWAGYAIFKTPGNPADPADITSVSIADVAVPRAGDVAETTFSTTTEDITVDGSTIQWWDNTAERFLEEGDKFDAGSQYTVTFTVTADDGYRFPLMDGAPDVRSFVNGKPAETRSVDGYAQEMVIKVSLTFPTVKEPEAPESGSDIGNFKITGIKNKTYTGKALTQNITVKDPEGHALTEDVDFIVTYKNNTDVGTAYAVITSAGDYEGFFIKTFKITKAKNPVRVAAKKSVTANSKKATTIKKAVAVTKAQGKVTYKTDNKKVTVRKGTMTVAKGLKKGKTYKVKVTVTAKGNSNYSSRKIVKTIKIKVN